MNKLLISFFLISTAFPLHASEWKTTNSCDDKIVVKAKEGESFVIIQKGNEEIKLFGKDGVVFHEQGMAQAEFVSSAQKAKYTFIYPSYVDGAPPKIDLVEDLKTKRCRLELAR